MAPIYIYIYIYSLLFAVGMDGAMVGLGGAMAPPKFFLILLNIWVLILAILF